MTEDTTPHANQQPVAGRALNDQLGAGAEAGMRKRALMRALRAPVDSLMLFGAWVTMYHATGSMWASAAACVAVAAYGLWCYADGCA